MWDASGQERLYYDGLGRVYKAERILDGHSYVSQTSYDALSRSYQVTLPDNEVLTYSYGANGLLSGMASSLGDTYLSGVEYNELNLPKRYLLGGSSPVRHSYYGLDYTYTSYPYGALRTIRWPEGSGSLVDRTMGYDPVGNVTSIDDGLEGESIAYGYDDLDRLLSAGAPIDESYSYSAIGNLLTKNGQSLSYGDPAHVHAVTAFGSAAYGYDANGSMVTRASQVVRYDPERRPVRVDENRVTLWRATYDGGGARRKRLDATGTVHYVRGYQRNVGNGQDTTEVITKIYRALGRMIAFRRNGILHWVGTDHLGGAVAVADASFNAIARMRYTPYGNARDDASAMGTDYLFTGQQLDGSTGLYWLTSRGYDPVLGRFVCADTIVPSPSNPQTLNRFSYANNSPLRYGDPSGHTALDGQSLSTQSQEVQDLFYGTYGSDAASIWESQHNQETSQNQGSSSGGGGGGGGGGSTSGGGSGGSSGGGGGSVVAIDGESLSTQSPDVQRLFYDTYGADADLVWAQQHDADIGLSGGGSSEGAASSQEDLGFVACHGGAETYIRPAETTVFMRPAPPPTPTPTPQSSSGGIPSAWMENGVTYSGSAAMGFVKDPVIATPLAAAAQIGEDQFFHPDMALETKLQRAAISTEIAGVIAVGLAIAGAEVSIPALLLLGLATAIGTNQVFGWLGIDR